MKRFVSCLFFGLFLSIGSSGQSLTNAQIYSLNRIIEKFVLKRDSVQEVRKSEFIIISLETDSAGHVSKIRLISDEQNRDRSYTILATMQSNEFDEWDASTCANKIILIPFYSLGSGNYSENAHYADQLFADLFWNRQRPARIIKERGRTIVVSPINYMAPQKDKAVSPAKGKSANGVS